MNRITSLIFLVAAAVLPTTPQLLAQDFGCQANVPFQFAVGDTTLPAGVYRISREGAFFRIQSQANFATVYVVASPIQPSQDGKGKLVFDEVSGLYFLRDLVAPSSSSSMELAVSKLEKKARAESSLRHIASSSAPVIVPVGAR